MPRPRRSSIPILSAIHTRPVACRVPPNDAIVGRSRAQELVYPTTRFSGGGIPSGGVASSVALPAPSSRQNHSTSFFSAPSGVFRQPPRLGARAGLPSQRQGGLTMSELPSAPVKRLLTEASGGCRISGSALVAAGTQVDNYIRRLGRAAGQLAAADRRKTIQDADVARAALELNAE
ncbi:MAG TPA: hypothetical protein EYQ83_18810 [Acidobacteria bacterium]|nr:hypothetical protein [Acidobacteriota bacterium]